VAYDCSRRSRRSHNCELNLRSFCLLHMHSTFSITAVVLLQARMTIRYISGILAMRAGGNCLSLKFWAVGKSSQEIFVKKCKIWGWKTFLRKFGEKRKLWAPEHHLSQCLSENATSYPAYVFFNQQRQRNTLSVITLSVISHNTDSYSVNVMHKIRKKHEPIY